MTMTYSSDKQNSPTKPQWTRPEPTWGGRTKGPESVAWLNWAREQQQQTGIRPPIPNSTGLPESSDGLNIAFTDNKLGRPPMRPGGSDWLNGTVGSPYRPPGIPSVREFAVSRPSSPVDGINFDNKKELNKQLAKLDQDLRSAKAQNDGGAIQRLEAKQQAASDVLKAMKAGYTTDEAKQFAQREKEIRQAMQRQAQSRQASDSTGSSPQSRPAPLDKLVKDAMAGGKAGEKAAAALQQRAAAGDPQAADALKDYRQIAQPKSAPAAPQGSFPGGKPFIPAGKSIPGKPGSVSDGKGGWSYPNGSSEAERNAQSQAQWAANKAAINKRSGKPSSSTQPPTQPQSPPKGSRIDPNSQPKKEPTAEEMAVDIDKKNRAREMAAQAAAQREAARKAAKNQDARNAAAQKMGFPNAAAAEKAGIKIGNIGEKVKAPVNSVSGGGGRRGGGRGLTAKERNDLANKRADQAARREDKGGLSDSAFDQKQRDAAKWKVPQLATNPKDKAPNVDAPIPDIQIPDIQIPQIQPTASAGGGARGFFTRADGTVVPIG